MKTRKLKTALPSLKPTVPKMLRSSVVYKIDCPGCDASYIGETLRLLQQRLREHLGKSGTIRKHLETCQPTFQPTLQNFEKQVTILACSNSPPKLLTHEALFIKVFDPSLNTKDEFRSRTLTLKFWRVTPLPVINFVCFVIVTVRFSLWVELDVLLCVVSYLLFHFFHYLY